MVQSLIHPGPSPSGIWVMWLLRNPYFESQFPNGQSLIQSRVSSGGIWVLRWLRHPYFESQIPKWFKVSCSQGCPPVVPSCSGGSKTRTLNRKFPMFQNLIQSRVSPIGIRVLRWLKNPYFQSQIPNGSKPHRVRGVPRWYLGAVVSRKPVL